MDTTLQLIDQAIYTRPNFPKKGILFYDISSLTANAKAFAATIDLLAEYARSRNATAIGGIDARGFIFGSAIAYKLGLPLYLLRKPGKLARESYQENYTLEYGTDGICLPQDDAKKGDRVVVVDDLIATGGTLQAACRLFEANGAQVSGLAAVIGLPYAGYEQKLKGHDIHCLLTYEAPNL
ncbi:MAG: adenine phosphoribosyltransferase [Sphaerochaetaceae bacterium]|jgi:adenine phosphoribosyltransferase|nr:adenine phosphoribosyltransferase [Spirochaetaceae bacterium]MDY6343779.1 adenine phosphoribosyltransferase [Sphaerochaetaceae bacterium]